MVNILVIFTLNYYILMENKESITHVLENMDKNIVYKKKSSFLRSSALIALGVVSFIVYTTFEWKTSDALPHFLFMLGSVFLIIGVLMFFFRKEHYYSAVSGQKLKLTQIYFQPGEQNKLVNIMDEGRIDEVKNLKTSVSDGLKLSVMATPDGKICFSQVIAYLGAEYVNITDAKSHSEAEAGMLASIKSK